MRQPGSHGEQRAGASDVKNFSHRVVATPFGHCSWSTGPTCHRTHRPSKLACASPPGTANRRHRHHQCTRSTGPSRQTNSSSGPTFRVAPSCRLGGPVRFGDGACDTAVRRQLSPACDPDVPSRQPVLALPMGTGGDLRRTRADAGGARLPVGTPTSLVSRLGAACRLFRVSATLGP